MAVAIVLFPAMQRNGGCFIVFGTEFGYFSVQVYDILTAGTFVKVVDVLCNNLC